MAKSLNDEAFAGFRKTFVLVPMSGVSAFVYIQHAHNGGFLAFAAIGDGCARFLVGKMRVAAHPSTFF